MKSNENKAPFEVFKSNVCHRVKNIGEIAFMIEILKSDVITEYFNKEWYDESLYLLAMLDYLSRKNDVSLCTRYERYRECKLAEIIYPQSILVASKVMNKPEMLKESYDNAIPEFKRFNIVENEVENVV